VGKLEGPTLTATSFEGLRALFSTVAELRGWNGQLLFVQLKHSYFSRDFF